MNIKEKIEIMRRQLYKGLDDSNLNKSNLLKLSQELDILIAEYYDAMESLSA